MKLCPFCQKEFDNHYGYMGHIAGHSRRGQKLPKPPNRHICTICNLEFRNGNLLAGHNTRIHKQKLSLEEKIQRYQCYVEKHTTPIQCYKIDGYTYDENIQYWVYGHYTDDHELFYIGIGPISRAYSLKNRNKRHIKVREEYGWNVGILWGPTTSREEILQKEREYIAKRHTHTRDPLAVKHASNFSIGGEHSSEGARWTLTPDQCKENSDRLKVFYASLTLEQKEARRKPSKLKGRKIPQEQKEKNRQSALKYHARMRLAKEILSWYESGTLWNN